MINKFGSEDKHLLCADGQVQHAIYCVQTSVYQYILSIYSDVLLSGVSCPCLSGFPEHGAYLDSLSPALGACPSSRLGRGSMSQATHGTSGQPRQNGLTRRLEPDSK